MNANEMVNLLRVRAETQNKRGYSGEASEWLELASLIERLEAEVKRWVDKHNQAALNFQQENAECRRLQEQLADEKDAHESTKLLRDSMYAEKDAQLAASQRRERAHEAAIKRHYADMTSQCFICYSCVNHDARGHWNGKGPYACSGCGKSHPKWRFDEGRFAQEGTK